MKKILLSLMAFCMLSASVAANVVCCKASEPAKTATAVAGNTFDKVDASRTIMVNGVERQYILYVPQGCPENAPMVVSMHGTGGHKEDRALRFQSVADEEKFIVVFPQGLNYYFPVFGGTLPGWESTGEYSKDVDFIRQLVEEVGKEFSVDRKRVYCCGFSNGGMNTYSLTNFCSDIFAAFGSISGFPINEFHMHHVGSRPVPFIHIHGKKDDFVKYSLVPVIIENMVARNGANPVAKRTSVEGKYDKNVFEATEGGFPVVFYECNDMGHNDWTANTEDGNSTVTMWKFFKQFTLDSPCDASLKWRPNIEAEGYNPKAHGWRVNLSKASLMFGGDQKTDANQNVYRSLQFTAGKYKLCFHAEGLEGTTLTVTLAKLTGDKNKVVNATVTKDGDVTLMFEVSDGWGEYKLSMLRQSIADDIKITKIAVYSVTDDEYTAVSDVRTSQRQDVAQVYSVGGVALSGIQAGLNLIKTKDGDARKVMSY